MPDYKKLKSAELEALLERRGLELSKAPSLEGPSQKARVSPASGDSSMIVWCLLYNRKSGTKTEKLARLVKQDAEEVAAEKATAAAVRAASTNAPEPAGGRENDQGMLADSSKSIAERAGANRAGADQVGADQVGADRAGAIKKSEAMRKERLGKSKKGKQVSDASFGALGDGTEGGEKEPDVDEQAFLKDLWEKAEMNRGHAKKAVPEAQKGGEFALLLE
ncbi:hypothetical protein SLS60_002472 [Paraconiothyrium brasiliense]|uniref:Uncharacterized protein n=1 Tax=Paraconiothyrium brasiliense TaxID=300254 RepID=A0ABR3S283_9PLEO